MKRTILIFSLVVFVASAFCAEPVSMPIKEKTLSINFQGVTLEQLLNYYSGIINRSILHPTSMADRQLFTAVSPNAVSREETAKLLEKALAEKGISTQFHGEKFCFVVPTINLAQLPAIRALQTNHVADATG
jgi:hypothetical protein